MPELEHGVEDDETHLAVNCLQARGRMVEVVHHVRSLALWRKVYRFCLCRSLAMHALLLAHQVQMHGSKMTNASMGMDWRLFILGSTVHPASTSMVMAPLESHSSLSSSFSRATFFPFQWEHLNCWYQTCGTLRSGRRRRCSERGYPSCCRRYRTPF